MPTPNRDDWYEVGLRDAEHGEWDPPHESSLPFPLKELFESHTDNEKVDRDDYPRGHRAGSD